MEIPYEKYKEEVYKFYKIGYSTSFRNLISLIEEFSNDKAPLFQRQSEELIEYLYIQYNSYPCTDLYKGDLLTRGIIYDI
jgi:hypothetical protein